MAMSLLCPIDFRYGRPKMKGVFEEESRLQRLLDVEAALARAEAKVGLIPEGAAAPFAEYATTKRRSVTREREHAEEARHVASPLRRRLPGDRRRGPFR